MPAPRKYPEFALPPILVEAFIQAIGVTRMKETTPGQRILIAILAQKTAMELTKILDHPNSFETGLEKSDCPE